MGSTETKSDHSMSVFPDTSSRSWPWRRTKDHAAGNAGERNGTLQLVLIGPKGSGKSSTGNLILGKEAFKEGTSTLKCQTETCKKGDRVVIVVDTPGLTGKESSDQEIILKLSQDRLKASVFLLVVPLEWNAKKSLGRYQEVRRALGKISADSTMVLVTHADQVQLEKRKEEDILQKGGLLQQAVEQCGGWFHLLNISESDQGQILELLEKADRMTLEDKGAQEEQCVKTEKDLRAAISLQKQRVQKRIKVMQNSERIIAENKELLRELRDETDRLEEDLKATIAEDKKQALMERIEQKAKDIQAKEEKILLHIGILQTLQQQMEEKRQHIREMEKEMRNREKEHASMTTHHPETKAGTRETGQAKNEPVKKTGIAGGTDVASTSTMRKNVQELENQMRSSRHEEEEGARERNMEYKAQLQKIKQKMATC